MKNEGNLSVNNCHRTNSKPAPADRKNDAEADSSTSKYVVSKDDRERRDGPGGE